MNADDAMEQLGRAAQEVAKSAQEHLERGVYPEAVALGLLSMSEGMPGAVKVAQIAALGRSMSAEELAEAAEKLAARMSPDAIKQILAELAKRLQSAEQGGSEPPTSG